MSSVRVVWRKFTWQRFGRFFLIYTLRGEVRYAKLSQYLSVLDAIGYARGQADGFRAGIITGSADNRSHSQTR